MDDARVPITVAIPTYNGARHIEAALRGILNQTNVAFDLIICDDRSTDDTVDRIKALAGDRARVEINSERLGLAGNWNRCVDRAETPLVSIFHQDDLMKEGHLQSHVAAFTDQTGMVASAVTMVDDSGQPIAANQVESGSCGSVARHFRAGEFLRELAVSNPLRCSAVTLRKAAHKSTGGFLPDYFYVVDWAHWIAIAGDWEVSWLPQATIEMRWHAASETHRFKTGTRDLEETYSLLMDLYHAHPDLASFEPVALRRLGRAFLNRAYEATHGRQPALVRRALVRAISLSPRLLLNLLADPRLAARLLFSQFQSPNSPMPGSLGDRC